MLNNDYKRTYIIYKLLVNKIGVFEIICFEKIVYSFKNTYLYSFWGYVFYE